MKYKVLCRHLTPTDISGTSRGELHDEFRSWIIDYGGLNPLEYPWWNDKKLVTN